MLYSRVPAKCARLWRTIATNNFRGAVGIGSRRLQRRTMATTKVYLDCETRLFEPGNMAPKMICLQYAVDGGPTNIVGADKAQDTLETLLADDNTTITGQNIAFDMSIFLENFPPLAPLIWDAYERGVMRDTMLAEKLLDIAQGDTPPSKRYSLAALVHQYFDREMDKSLQRSFGALEHVPVEKWPAENRAYAVTDVVDTRAVDRAQTAHDYPAFEDEVSRQCCYSFALRLLSARGMMVDQDHVTSRLEALRPQQAALCRDATKAGFIRANGTRDMMAVRDAVQVCLGVGTPHTEKGNICTDADTIALCATGPLSSLAALAKLDRLETYFQTYRAAGNAPVHAAYDALGAKTGRTSCFKPNLENVPRTGGVRECFVPRPGWLFADCDYDSQEMRCWAEVCSVLLGHSRLAEMYGADPDYDPHVDFAARLLGLDYSAAMAAKKAGDTRVLDYRQRAKAANFGFPGGMGPAKMRAYASGYGVVLTLQEATALRDAWRDQYPEARAYARMISDMTQEAPARVTQLYSGRVRGGCTYTEASNTFFQGLASDISKSALYEVTKKCFGEPGTSALAGCRPVLFAHDEIMIEAPESYAAEAALELQATMITAMQVLTPHVPARVSACLMRRWSKGAKPVYDASGRLMPWEPK